VNTIHVLHEVPTATVQNWRGASLKASEIEDDWRDMNLVDFDLEAHLGRFETLRRPMHRQLHEGVQLACQGWHSGVSVVAGQLS
jgi:hypothetical protein